MALKETIKRRLPGLRRALRPLSRLRVDLKLAQVRREGAGIRRAPLATLKFLLVDPELHSYTYDLDNEDELCEFVARLCEVSPGEVAGYLAEAHADPELTDRLRRRVRWRLEYKRRLPVGNRLLWYALTRVVKPALVVETGIYQGLGSLVVLRALERNAEDGRVGRLISLDIDPDSGWLVPEDQRARWTMVVTDIEQRIDAVLDGESVDLFIHESDHNEPLQRAEFAAALAHAADPLYVVDSSGDELPVLRSLSERHGGTRKVFRERPHSHFYVPAGTAVAVFDASVDATVPDGP